MLLFRLSVVFYFCLVAAVSLLFLFPNPIIVSLQLFETRGAILDRCEGTAWGKLESHHLP